MFLIINSILLNIEFFNLERYKSNSTDNLILAVKISTFFCVFQRPRNKIKMFSKMWFKFQIPLFLVWSEAKKQEKMGLKICP